MAGEKVTKQRTAKKETKKTKAVILNGRFVHRDVDADMEAWSAAADTEKLIERLAEYFALDDAIFITSPFDAENANPMKDDMPRFQQSHRDGLQLPMEGQDGTGN